MLPAGPVYTIPPGVSFVDALAQGLLAETVGDPGRLAGYRILLPTRRACRALTDAFLRQSGGAALLPPTMTPIGDVDETELAFGAEADGLGSAGLDIPPAIPDLRRRLLLAEAIVKHRSAAGEAEIRPDQAVRLAEELARLLDQVQAEGLPFDGLADLAPEEYADHWQITLRFLDVLTDHWPAILAAEGCIDPADRRNRLIQALIRQWTDKPPRETIVIAGSTGSVPATADLMATVAGLPGGMVVLPGLDTGLDRRSIEAIEATHPQYGMVLLVRKLGIRPADVPDWPAITTDINDPPRADVLRHVMRPSGVAPEPADAASVAQAVEKLRRVDAANAQEEAVAVALMLREVLETPGKTAALVTPDRGLARRVAAELRRWDVEIDDSAGAALGDTEPGGFLRLTASMLAEQVAPIPLLACLKHPLAGGGEAPGRFREQVRAMELAILRGPRPGPGFEGIAAALRGRENAGDLVAWVETLAQDAAPFASALADRTAPLSDVVAAHVGFAEALAATDGEPGAAQLWRGDAGAEAAAFVRELHASASRFPAVQSGSYPSLLTVLMRGRVVRPSYGRHPRLHIWGPLEARLQQVDLVVLGGLNEGTWPPDPPPDPWMSRPMRSRFGLPPPERRIGLSAHDFAQAFSAEEVVMTRARRVEGTPTVPSRWLLRLDNVLDQVSMSGELQRDQPRWLDWQERLDRPALPVRSRAPGPCPPLAARPRQLSVTQIETLIRDPYAIYARHILKLRRLDPLDADPGAADRGTIIHETLDRFFEKFPSTLPDDALDALIAIGEQTFGDALARPGVRAFWWPRFLRVAAWFIAHERARRLELRDIRCEITGTLVLDAPGGPFTLVGKADRLDTFRDGAVEIVDYKTGGIPRTKDVDQFFAPQLPLEALIAAEGGFPGLGAVTPERLSYWRLSGGDPPGAVTPAGTDVAALVDGVRSGLIALIGRYDDLETPYLSRPDPDHAPARSDYDHLARVTEWSTQDGGDAS